MIERFLLPTRMSRTVWVSSNFAEQEKVDWYYQLHTKLVYNYRRLIWRNIWCILYCIPATGVWLSGINGDIYSSKSIVLQPQLGIISQLSIQKRLQINHVNKSISCSLLTGRCGIEFSALYANIFTQTSCSLTLIRWSDCEKFMLTSTSSIHDWYM